MTYWYHHTAPDRVLPCVQFTQREVSRWAFVIPEVINQGQIIVWVRFVKIRFGFKNSSISCFFNDLNISHGKAFKKDWD